MSQMLKFKRVPTFSFSNMFLHFDNFAILNVRAEETSATGSAILFCVLILLTNQKKGKSISLSTGVYVQTVLQ